MHLDAAASSKSPEVRTARAIRRIAMLLAEQAPESVVAEAAVEEATRLLEPAQVRMVRVDDPANVDATIAQITRDAGPGRATTVPITVAGTVHSLLVAIMAGPDADALPTDALSLLSDLGRLVGGAIAAAHARAELHGLAESQGALRRVATLVAQGTEPQAVFTAVAKEAARFLRVGAVSLIRYDPDTQLFTKIFGTHGDRAAIPDGGQWGLEDCPEGALVLETGRPCRIDDWSILPGPVAARHVAGGFGQAVAAPIVIGGSFWGHIAAYGEADEILPAGSELRLDAYTRLMASALANAQARDELRALAEQQGAALRRVATLVTQQAPPNVVFTSVAREASRALGVAHVDVCRCEPDGSLVLLGSTMADSERLPVVPSSAEAVASKVRETSGATRIDDTTGSAGGVRSVVGAPIFVEGELWGVIVVLSQEPLHRDTETRLTDFTHLVAGSISNVNARHNLIASRARIVTASDETRRRIERNLHDGIQQRLVVIALKLRTVSTKFQLASDAQSGLNEVARDLDGVLEEIRIFSQGLHPALLARAGLGPSLRELARRSPIPALVDAAGCPRFAEPIETAVYYVVSEALANAAKHSRATEVSVTVSSDSGTVRAVVADNGVGGAAHGRGSGLIGLVDRVEALGGRLILDSPPGQGTTISIELPLSAQPTESVDAGPEC